MKNANGGNSPLVLYREIIICYYTWSTVKRRKIIMISKILKSVIVFTAFLTIGSICLSSAFAGNGKSVEVLDQMQARIEKQNKTIANLQQRTKEADGSVKEALDVRLDKAWRQLLEDNLVFAERVAE